MKKAVIGLMLAVLGVNRICGSAEKQEESVAIPYRLLEFKEKYPEAADYVDHYPDYYDMDFEIDLSKEAELDTVPALIQWDKRWGYKEYGNSFIGNSACGPTCLSMVALYLTEHAEYSPDYVADYAMSHDYYVPGAGTAWGLFTDGCEDFGLQAETLNLSKDKIRTALENGRPVICSMKPGDFTKSGHLIVLAAIDEEGVTVNDPNSPNNSSRKWDLDTLVSQMKMSWSFEKDDL